MSGTGPLAGITVVDLTRVLAGPYCTLILADLGARVVKVELPGRGDDARHIGPFVESRSAYFASVNRGKESIALDLKSAEDREIFERFPLHVVPTYPGDSEWFASDAFQSMLPDDWEGYPLRKDYEFPLDYHGIPGTTEYELTNPRH